MLSQLLSVKSYGLVVSALDSDIKLYLFTYLRVLYIFHTQNEHLKYT